MNAPAYPASRDLLKGKTVVVTAAAGTGIGYAVMNLQGRTFMASLDDPFRTADRERAIQGRLALESRLADKFSSMLTMRWVGACARNTAGAETAPAARTASVWRRVIISRLSLLL